MNLESKEKNKEEKKEKSKLKKQTNTDMKVYNILSYIAILWLVGFLGPDKDNKKVRFHVGQGILVTILWAIVSIINNVIIANIFTNTYTVLGVTYTTGISGLGYTIMGAFSLIPVVFSIIGIINACNDRELELPIIGKYSFYK